MLMLMPMLRLNATMYVTCHIVTRKTPELSLDGTVVVLFRARGRQVHDTYPTAPRASYGSLERPSSCNMLLGFVHPSLCSASPIHPCSWQWGAECIGRVLCFCFCHHYVIDRMGFVTCLSLAFNPHRVTKPAQSG